MKILYLPPIAYHDLKQRPQFLAAELAKDHQLLYVDPTVSAMKFLLKGGERPGGYTYPVSENLTVARLNGCFSAHRSLEGIWSGFGFPERVQMKKYLEWADWVWIGYAPWFDLIREFSGIVLYDKMDDDIQITRNKLLRKLISKVEPELSARADRVFATSQCFYEHFLEQGKAPILVPNAVDGARALRMMEPIRPKEPGTVVFGYVGMISHWFDMEAVQTILEADFQNRVILVGPVEIPRLEHPGLIYVGRVPGEQVDRWIASFDICLYPFRKSSFLDTINPVKLYEYLAANKPVLAMESRELEQYSELVNTYRSIEELKKCLSTQKLHPPFESDGERVRFIECNCWKARYGHIQKELVSCGARSKEETV